MKYIVEYGNGYYIVSHCQIIITSKDIKQAKRFDNRNQIRSFRSFWGIEKKSINIIPE